MRQAGENGVTRFIPIGIVAMSALAGTSILLHLTSSTSAQILKPEDPDIVALGKQVYATNCASCHGTNLEGAPNWKLPDKDGLFPAPPHDETGHTWHHSEKLLFDLTKYGLAKVAGLKDRKSNMPVYENVLSDEDIIAVLSFIKSSWPEEIKRRHTRMSAREQ